MSVGYCGYCGENFVPEIMEPEDICMNCLRDPEIAADYNESKLYDQESAALDLLYEEELLEDY